MAVALRARKMFRRTGGMGAIRARGNYVRMSTKMGPRTLGFLPMLIPLAVGLGTQLFGKLMSGGKGHQCSKTATDQESFLACWPYQPIPNNYVPCYTGSTKGWDWCFYYGATGGRPNPGMDPNVAVNQQEVQAWTAAGVPISCDANGICRRNDGGCVMMSLWNRQCSGPVTPGQGQAGGMPTPQGAATSSTTTANSTGQMFPGVSNGTLLLGGVTALGVLAMVMRR